MKTVKDKTRSTDLKMENKVKGLRRDKEQETANMNNTQFGWEEVCEGIQRAIWWLLGKDTASKEGCLFLR
jgi:hypothetical protein